ncbi:hypothetical protein HZ326_4609 [Fusarium oxysporum f. sp. albedinis]|nr:hypothetical protein HZ326_4609 [Fusarium oxysporum f. sp. albedinis]
MTLQDRRNRTRIAKHRAAHQNRGMSKSASFHSNVTFDRVPFALDMASTYILYNKIFFPNIAYYRTRLPAIIIRFNLDL